MPHGRRRGVTGFYADGDVLGVVFGGVVADFDGVGVGVLDGDGAGPFASAAAIALVSASSVGLTDLPFTQTVGVAFTPRLDALSVIAETSAACCFV